MLAISHQQQPVSAQQSSLVPTMQCLPGTEKHPTLQLPSSLITDWDCLLTLLSALLITLLTIPLLLPSVIWIWNNQSCLLVWCLYKNNFNHSSVESALLHHHITEGLFPWLCVHSSLCHDNESPKAAETWVGYQVLLFRLNPSKYSWWY